MPRLPFHVGCKVTCRAQDALGRELSQRVYPSDPNAEVVGKCVDRAPRPQRKWIVRFQYVLRGTTHNVDCAVASRLLTLHQDVAVPRTPNVVCTPASNDGTERRHAQSLLARGSDSPSSNALIEADFAYDGDSDVDSDDEDDIRMDLSRDPGPDLLCPHEQSWKLEEHGITRDLARVYSHHTKFRWRSQSEPMEQSLLQYFLRLYPSHLETTLQVTSTRLRQFGYAPIDKQEYFAFLAVHIAFADFPKCSVEEMLRPQGNWCDLNSTPSFGKYMSYARYKAISTHLTFTDNPCSSSVYAEVQPLVDAFNANRRTTILPGPMLTIGQSLSPWKLRDRNVRDSRTFVTMMKSKPKGIGIMIKNTADVETGIMYSIELAGPNDEMRHRRYNADGLPSGTGFCLRLTEHVHGSGRVLLGDSAFASFTTATELHKRGLFFIGHIKTNHRMFPQAYLRDTSHYNSRGEHRTVSTEFNGAKIMGIGWNEGTRKANGEVEPTTYISSCSTSSAGSPHRKRRVRTYVDGTSSVSCVSVPRPTAIALYHNGCQVIDVHNHLGQHTLGLEKRRTSRWQFRVWQTIMRFTIVDTYYAFRHFCPGQEDLKFSVFLQDLKHVLCNNTVGCAANALPYRPSARPNINDGGNGGGDSQSAGTRHIHIPCPITNTRYFQNKLDKARREGGKAPAEPRLLCKHCHQRTSRHCATCTSQNDDSRPSNIVALCDVIKGNCFAAYHQALLARPPPSVTASTRTPSPIQDTSPPRQRPRYSE